MSCGDVPVFLCKPRRAWHNGTCCWHKGWAKSAAAHIGFGVDAHASARGLSNLGGEVRQNSNTRNLIYDVQRLIEYASSMYTLYPGDVILTGTPAGVGPVSPGDVLTAEIESIGRFEVGIAPAYAG